MSANVLGQPQIQIQDKDRMHLIYEILQTKLGDYRNARGLRMLLSLQKKTTEQLMVQVEKLRTK